VPATGAKSVAIGVVDKDPVTPSRKHLREENESTPRPQESTVVEDWKGKREAAIAARKLRAQTHAASEKTMTVEESDDAEDVRVTSHTDADGRETKKTKVTDPKDGHIVKILETVIHAHPLHVRQIGCGLKVHRIGELSDMMTDHVVQQAAVQAIFEKLTSPDSDVGDEALFRVATGEAVDL
jgi:hypothetical protein